MGESAPHPPSYPRPRLNPLTAGVIEWAKGIYIFGLFSSKDGERPPWCVRSASGSVLPPPLCCASVPLCAHLDLSFTSPPFWCPQVPQPRNHFPCHLCGRRDRFLLGSSARRCSTPTPPPPMSLPPSRPMLTPPPPGSKNQSSPPRPPRHTCSLSLLSTTTNIYTPTRTHTLAHLSAVLHATLPELTQPPPTASLACTTNRASLRFGFAGVHRGEVPEIGDDLSGFLDETPLP